MWWKGSKSNRTLAPFAINSWPQNLCSELTFGTKIKHARCLVARSIQGMRLVKNGRYLHENPLTKPRGPLPWQNWRLFTTDNMLWNDYRLVLSIHICTDNTWRQLNATHPQSFPDNYICFSKVCAGIRFSINKKCATFSDTKWANFLVPYLLFDNGLFGHKNYLFLFLTKRTNQPNMLLVQNKFIHNFLCLLGPTFGTTSNPPKAVQCVQKLYPVLCRFSAQNMTIEGATRHKIQHWNLEVTFFYHCACFSTY